MKVTFLIQPTGLGVTLVQHQTRDINRRVGKFAKVSPEHFNHEAEWQRRWKQDRELQERYAGRFYDGEDMSSSPVNPYDIPILIGILSVGEFGLVSWLEDADEEDRLVIDNSKQKVEA